MKIKNLFIGLGMVCLAQATMAQGLDGIIVERYYQADATDAAYTSTEGYTVPLTAGAVTYRVYVDMAAGYKFVQMFGTSTQNLVFNTTTSFYNDENYDSQTAPSISVVNTKKHTAMIDSWLTAGFAAAGKVGVPKDEDNDGSIANPHTNGILGNALGACFGDMITGASGKDGMLASSGTTAVTVNTVGMGGSILDALVAGNSLGNITVSNGSLAALGGITGATASNKVLVGQFTTDGVFSFSINVQLLNPSGQAVNYVHSNVGSGQLGNASLTFSSATSGTSAVTVAATSSSICSGTSVTFTASPSNAGTTPSYQWKVNGTNVGTDATYTSATLANGDVVTCTLTPGGCFAPSPAVAANSNSITMVVTTAPNAGTLSGNQSLCPLLPVNFTTDGNAGGSWTSSNPTVANINPFTGVVTALVAGSATMTYTVLGTGGCSNATATRTVTVNAAPNAGTLSGNQALCSSGTVTYTSNGTAGGAWTSSSTAVATIDGSTGAITPVSAGTSTITYTVTNATTGCTASATRSVTVTAATSYYLDNDGDTYGSGTVTSACTSPGATYVTNNTDCNDASSSVNPAGVEVCDGVDNDCTGGIDNGLSFVNYYNDADGDTYGAGTAVNACSSPGASYVTNNTDCNDASSSANPVGTEVCGNSIDEDCSGTDLACTGAGSISTGSTTVSVIGNYGTGAQSNVTVNLATGTNSTESPGVGNDRWYSFVAQNNAVRIALTGSSSVADDNDLGLYNAPASSGVQLQPIATENDVHPGAQGAAADGGSEILYYGQLVTGQTYFVCVRNNNSTPGTCGLSISYLRASQNDIAIYTNNTNTYSSTCSNFKVAFRSGAQSYTVNRWSTNSMTGSPAHSFTIPSGTITQLGRIVPANLSGVAQPVYTSVSVTYNLPDAFGNPTPITANGTVLGTFTLNSENAVTVRAIDQCAAGFKSVTSAVTTDRSICGASQYNWQFTQVLPSAGLNLSVNGALGASRILALSSVQGIANGQKYDVKIRPLHLDGVTYSDFGATAACVKTIGAAGMVVENSNEVMHSSALSSIQVYPNPSNGQVLNISWQGVNGLVKVMVLDATGKEVMEKNWVAENGLLQTLSFNEKLSSGLYNIALINNNETQVVRFSVTK
jgi:uncharacterized protein YjdB